MATKITQYNVLIIEVKPFLVEKMQIKKAGL